MVFLPYRVLCKGIAMNLSHNAFLKVETLRDIRTKLKDNLSSISLLHLPDVIVGTYHDMSSDFFNKLIRRWPMIFKDKKVELGYIAIDEVHDIITEQDYRLNCLKKIPRINFDSFQRSIYYLGLWVM